MGRTVWIRIVSLPAVSVMTSLYESLCSGKTVIFQSTHRLEKCDSLFYTDVCAAGGAQLKAD